MDREERELLLSLKREPAPARAALRLFAYIGVQPPPPPPSPPSPPRSPFDEPYLGQRYYELLNDVFAADTDDEAPVRAFIEEREERMLLLYRTRSYVLLEAFNAVLDYPITQHSFSLEQWRAKIPAIRNWLDSVVDKVSSQILAIRKVERAAKAEELHAEYIEVLGGPARLRVPDDQLSTIQDLVNELRDAVASATFLSDTHRQRLLARLEKFQQELHKPIGDLDRFFGIVVEFGSVLGEFGERAKPMLDRVRELGDITVRLHRQLWGLGGKARVEVLTGEQQGNQRQLPPADEGASGE